MADSPTIEEASSRVREADALYDAKHRGAILPRLTGQAMGERSKGLLHITIYQEEMMTFL